MELSTREWTELSKYYQIVYSLSCQFAPFVSSRCTDKGKVLTWSQG